jgi:hypothetical protein
VGNGVEALQDLLDVGREVERVRDDDAVEALGELERLGGLDVEFAAGAALPRADICFSERSIPTLLFARG